ncbi:transcription factor A, mitochondrial-like [Armigeres subalbatus]|uniref:transcription factor A, mitochondrial-like n=1 Tax=Armigeres subalbatus TaxID=124917 RepID=UPI002ED5F7BB
MQMNNLARLFNCVQLKINSRTALPSYQLANTLNTTSFLSDQAASDPTLTEKPKRPINAFLRYYQSVRPILQAKNPTVSLMDISKLVSAQWKDLNATKKTKLQREFNADHAIWLQKNAKYLEQLTDQRKQDIRQARADKAAKRAKREHRKKLKELGRPKRPLTAFLLYHFDKRPNKLTKDQIKSLVKQHALEWSHMSNEEKDQYNKRSAEALAKYREDVAQWEKEMIARDHVDVVRRKHAANIPTVARKDR